MQVTGYSQFQSPSPNGQFTPAPAPAPAPPAFNPALYQQPMQPPAPVVPPQQPLPQPPPAAWQPAPQQPLPQAMPQQLPQQYPQQPAPPAPAAQPQPLPQPGSFLDPNQPGQQQPEPGIDPALTMAYQNYYQQQLAQQQLAQQQGQPMPPGWPQQPQEEQWDVDKHFNQVYGAPEWRPDFQYAIDSGMVAMSDNGYYVPASPEVASMASAILPALNQYEQHRKAAIGGMFEGNPYKNVWSAMEKPVEHMIEQKAQELVEQTLERRDTEQYLDQYIRDNQSWMFTTDQQGNQVLTQAGQAMQQSARELYEQGVDAKRAIEYAEAKSKPAAQPAPMPAMGPQTLAPDQGLQQAFSQFPQLQPMPNTMAPPPTGQPAPTPMPQYQQPAPLPTAQMMQMPAPQQPQANGATVLPPDPTMGGANGGVPNWRQASAEPLPAHMQTGYQPQQTAPQPQSDPSFLQQAATSPISYMPGAANAAGPSVLPETENFSVAEQNVSNFWNEVGRRAGLG